jgi:hypothetical protein
MHVVVSLQIVSCIGRQSGHCPIGHTAAARQFQPNNQSDQQCNADKQNNLKNSIGSNHHAPTG